MSANSGSGVPTAIAQFSDFAPDLNKQLQAIENDPMMGALEKEQRKRMCITFSLQQNMSPLDKYRKLNQLCVNVLSKEKHYFFFIVQPIP